MLHVTVRATKLEPPMPSLIAILHTTPESIRTFWVLARIIIPIAIATELMLRAGIIKAVAPVFAPVMSLVGLPPELGLAWLTAMLVGVWGAVPLIFTLVPLSSLSTADVTVFSLRFSTAPNFDRNWLVIGSSQSWLDTTE